MTEQIHWTGWGRWTLFTVAGLLLFLSVPLVLSNSAAAGWNIFLALLLFGAVASGSRRAPTVAFVLAALFVLRSIIALVSGALLLAVVIEAGFGIATAAAAYQLRRQAIA